MEINRNDGGHSSELNGQAVLTVPRDRIPDAVINGIGLDKLFELLASAYIDHHDAEIIVRPLATPTLDSEMR